jgi:hypothetical protein
MMVDGVNNPNLPEKKNIKHNNDSLMGYISHDLSSLTIMSILFMVIHNDG